MKLKITTVTFITFQGLSTRKAALDMAGMSQGPTESSKHSTVLETDNYSNSSSSTTETPGKRIS